MFFEWLVHSTTVQAIQKLSQLSSRMTCPTAPLTLSVIRAVFLHSEPFAVRLFEHTVAQLRKILFYTILMVHNADTADTLVFELG